MARDPDVRLWGNQPVSRERVRHARAIASMAWMQRRRREISISAQKASRKSTRSATSSRERVQRGASTCGPGASARGMSSRRPRSPVERRADEDVVRQVVLTCVARGVRRPAPEAPEEPKVRDRRREREGRAAAGETHRRHPTSRAGASAARRRRRPARRRRSPAPGRSLRRAPRNVSVRLPAARSARSRCARARAARPQRRSRLVCLALPPLPGRHHGIVEVGTDRGQQQRRLPHQLSHRWRRGRAGWLHRAASRVSSLPRHP